MFHYTMSGLDYIWLKNGFRVRETQYGKSVSIEDMEGLHSLIANDIVSNRVEISGAEFRFLRKELKLSQEAVAAMLGNEAQTISLWERGEGKVPQWADRMLRALYIETTTGNAGLRQIVDRINSLERELHELKQKQQQLRLELEGTTEGWARAA